METTRLGLARMILWTVFAWIPVGGLIGLGTGWFSGYRTGLGAVFLGLGYVSTPLAIIAMRRSRLAPAVLAALAGLYVLAGLLFFRDGDGPVFLSLSAAGGVLAAFLVSASGHKPSTPKHAGI